MTIADFLEHLDGVRRSGSGWSARCPAHDDRTPSLSIAQGKDGRVLVKCMAGCSTSAVLAALGLDFSDLHATEAPASGQRKRCIAPAVPRALARPLPPAVNMLPHAKGWCERTDVTPLANALGVSSKSLAALRVGWATSSELRRLNTGCTGRGCWAFPMRDDRRDVIGVRLRGESDRTGRSRKWAVTGSRQGLFIPADLPAELGRTDIQRSAIADWWS